jgi:hypothetical protein
LAAYRLIMRLKSLGLQVLRKKELTILCILLLVLPLASQPPSAQATPRLQDKAFRFLTDVIGVDMSNYKISYANGLIPETDSLIYKLDPAKLSNFAVAGNVVFRFHDDSLISCSFSPGTINQPYLHPQSDRFNQTLAIMQQYYAWTNDTQVQQMIDLMKKVGSEKDSFEISGNLSFGISITQSGANYQFSNYLNGVDYSGVTVGIGNSTGDVYFEDTRVWEKIGDTSINITQDQASGIAQDYLKGYTLKYGYGNGTILPISNLNVTGVYGTHLHSLVRDNVTLYPLYSVLLNVTGLPTKTVGVGVSVWANDGTIQSVHQLSIPNGSSHVNWNPNLIFFQWFFNFFMYPFVILCFSVAVIAAVLIIILRRKKAPPNSADKPSV